MSRPVGLIRASGFFLMGHENRGGKWAWRCTRTAGPILARMSLRHIRGTKTPSTPAIMVTRLWPRDNTSGYRTLPQCFIEFGAALVQFIVIEKRPRIRGTIIGLDTFRVTRVCLSAKRRGCRLNN